MFSYLHDGTEHTNTSKAYMLALGLDEEAAESVLNQKAFESSLTPRSVKAFKHQRQALIDKSIVEISTGKHFDANERSISRLGNAIIKTIGMQDSEIIQWSTADVETGVMVNCTKAEIVEAHALATDNFAAAWSVNK